MNQAKRHRSRLSRSRIFALFVAAVALHGCARNGKVVKHKAIEPHARNMSSEPRTLTVIRIDRTYRQPHAEIDGGVKDGVQIGDHFYIVNGGTLIADLEIVWVDPNYALGKISLESTKRGSAQVGQSAVWICPLPRPSGWQCGRAMM